MPKKKTITDEDIDLLGELGVDTTPEKKADLSPKEQRIIAGFEEIQRFVEEQGHLPEPGDQKDIFERLHAVRLERLASSDEALELLRPYDTGGLLQQFAEAMPGKPDLGDANDDELLAALGLAEEEDEDDITQLKHVRARSEIEAAEEVAQRKACRDFALFKPIFELVQNDLDSGSRKTSKFKDNASIELDDLFILQGQKILVADVGEEFTTKYGRPDRRLRVIYDNGTEIAILRRSLERSLQKDKSSRRISKPDHGPLFSNELEEGDTASGSVYVLRSCSQDPFIAEHRDVIHKIGVTGSEVKKRIANAKKDPTYLLADVEIVAEFKLHNINRKSFEALLHKFFAPARIDLQIADRFDQKVDPKEWFLVPLPIIEQAVELIMKGEIVNYHFEIMSSEIKRNNKAGGTAG